MSTSNARPPRAAEFLVRFLHPPRVRDFVLGDLQEQFLVRVRAGADSGEGPGAARRWYWRQVLRTVPAALRWRMTEHPREHGTREAVMRTLMRDVLYAMRSLRRSPGFSLVVVLTLGLGIGAATGIFSVVDGVLLKPLPFADSERVMAVCETRDTHRVCTASTPNVHDWEERSRSFERFGIARNWPHVIGGVDGVTSVDGGLATPGLFDVLDGSAVVGRVLRNEDLEPGDNRVVLLTYGFWTRWMGADPGVVGKSVVIDDIAHTVIGVLDPDFDVPDLGFVELWTPLPFRPSDEEQRSWRGFMAFGRLAPGISPETAQTEMDRLARDLEAEHPETNEAWGVGIQPLKEYVIGAAKDRLDFFLGAVALVLLLACVNVANLQIARATTRSRELAVRASLGAGRGRLMAMLLSEGLLLSAAGAVLGVAVALVGVPAFLSLAPANIPRLDEVSVDGRTLAFALAVAALTTVVFALSPFVRRGQAQAGNVLRSRGEAPGAARARSVLVAFEVATAMVLLIGAGLLARSFTSQLSHDPEFDHEHMLAAWAYVDGDGEAEAAVRRFRALADELQGMPGIDEVGLGSSGPFVGWTESTTFWLAAGDVPEVGSEPMALCFDVDPHYFSSQGIPVTAGRAFTPFDDASAPPVVVVNEALVRARFQGVDPVGGRLALGQWDGAEAEIVGVVADVTTAPGRPAQPTIYWPQLQHPRFATFFFVRASGDPAEATPLVRGRLENAGSDLALASLYTVRERMGQVLVEPRFTMALLWIFSVVALGLAAVGIYGMMSYAVSRRTREIGVRMALGAAGPDVLGHVMYPSLRLVLLGTGVGLVAAFGLRRFIAGFLVGVGPADPVTYVLGPLALVTVAALSALLPARRAARVDPTEAMRVE